MGYLFASGLGERYVREDEEEEEEERGPVSWFAGTPTLADLRDFCRPELKAIQKAGEGACADLAIELWIRFGAPRDRDAVQGLGRGREGLEDRQAERLQEGRGILRLGAEQQTLNQKETRHVHLSR
jgi:hypothetical protein